MTVDSRKFLSKNNDFKENSQNGNFINEQPAILITGQFHSREHITSEMTLYSMLKMIHGGMFH